MNRPLHFNFIEEKLLFLAFRIASRGKLNLLDLNLHAENFYQYFFNELFGWQLQNLNAIKQNAEAIDLIDHKKKIIIQVSATATKAKVESALTKDLLSGYAGYTFKFISISKDAGDLRKQNFANPHNLTFDLQTDIYDVTSILRYISARSVDDQKQIAAFLKKELVAEVDPVRLESNLATIITILSKEDWSSDNTPLETIPFEIDKKIEFNNLRHRRDIIDEYYVHGGKVARIYADYDREGSNKSQSVLDAIKGFYRAHKSQLSDDALFDKIVELVAKRVQESPNFTALPIEELDLCVNILVVDTFLRCKIFKNPEGYAHAAA